MSRQLGYVTEKSRGEKVIEAGSCCPLPIQKTSDFEAKPRERRLPTPGSWPAWGCHTRGVSVGGVTHGGVYRRLG